MTKLGVFSDDPVTFRNSFCGMKSRCKTISIRNCGNQKRYFKTNHAAFLNLTKWFFDQFELTRGLAGTWYLANIYKEDLLADNHSCVEPFTSTEGEVCTIMFLQ